jgi:hypothetical protein
MPFSLQLQPNVHNIVITHNSAISDELFSAMLSGGGVTFCTGNDYYKFNYNWICRSGQLHRMSAVLHETICIRVKYDSGDGQEFSQKYTVVTPRKGEK